jgi:hypothetical protein
MEAKFNPKENGKIIDKEIVISIGGENTYSPPTDIDDLIFIVEHENSIEVIEPKDNL